MILNTPPLPLPVKISLIVSILQFNVTMTSLIRHTCMHPVCHAELNAILNKNASTVKGCTMYVALFPCNDCAKLIIQSGLKEVVYVSDKYFDKPEMKASRKLLDMAKIECRFVCA